MRSHSRHGCHVHMIGQIAHHCCGGSCSRLALSFSCSTCSWQRGLMLVSSVDTCCSPLVARGAEAPMVAQATEAPQRRFKQHALRQAACSELAPVTPLANTCAAPPGGREGHARASNPVMPLHSPPATKCWTPALLRQMLDPDGQALAPLPVHIMLQTTP